MPYVQENRFHPYGAPVERGGLPAPSPTEKSRLPVWKTAGRSLGASFAFLPSLLKAAVFPVALHLALLLPPLAILADRMASAWMAQLQGLPAAQIDRPLALITLAILLLVSFTASSLFVAAWSRALALGPDRGMVTLLPEWGRRGWRTMRMRFFVFACLVLAAVFAAAGARGVLHFLPQPWAAAPGILGGLLALTALILALRVSVGTVAAALNDPWSVDETLRATRRHNLRLFFGMLLTLVLGGIFTLLVFALLAGVAALTLGVTAGLDVEDAARLAEIDWGWRNEALAGALLTAALFCWYLLRALAFAFLTQAWLFFRKTPHAPAAGSAGRGFEPTPGNEAGHGTRSGGAWPGDLARYGDAAAAEREEDWVEPAEARRVGLPPEEVHAASAEAAEPYGDLWEDQAPQPADEEPQPTGDRWRRGPDIFESLRREPAYDDEPEDPNPQRG
jgi:hypothetical protein